MKELVTVAVMLFFAHLGLSHMDDAATPQAVAAMPVSMALR